MIISKETAKLISNAASQLIDHYEKNNHVLIINLFHDCIIINFTYKYLKQGLRINI